MKSRRLKSKQTVPGNLTSIDVGKNLRIVPIWERGIYAGDRVQLIIEPGPAFGSGNHASTTMALEFVESTIEQLRTEGNPSPSMLDIGTGTGILAIAARKLGAGLVVGVDIDSASVYIAKKNFRNSGLISDSEIPNDVFLITGGVECIRGTFELVVANVAAPLLVRLRDDILNLGDKIVLSGISDELRGWVAQHYASAGCEITAEASARGWNSFVLRHNIKRRT